MGSIIYLGLDRLEIDWGKNNTFRNHSQLFLQSDIKEIPYYYANNHVEYQKGYSKKLKYAKSRLELLGYTRETLEIVFNQLYKIAQDDECIPKISFERLIELIQALNVKNIDFDNGREPYDYDFGEFISKYLFKQEELADSNLNYFLENLDPYFLLGVLADNPNNMELELQWRYADVVDGGWVTEEEIQQGLLDYDKYLVVTEGSSDTYIIKKTIELLYPEVADFFYFIDMHEHYPFTGTGNLFKFSQGLASISIQNKTILIYDNDVAGIEKYNKTYTLTLPKNMKVMHLPYLEEFENFNTIGPNGNSFENINGKAVAIELFLDLTFKESREPIVRWSLYNKETDSYQGELEHKEAYVTKFKDVKSKDENYNFQKLQVLISKLFKTCTTIHI